MASGNVLELTRPGQEDEDDDVRAPFFLLASVETQANAEF